MILRRMFLFSVMVFLLAAGAEADDRSGDKGKVNKEKQTKQETVEKGRKTGGNVRDKDVAAELEMLKMMEMLEHIDLLEDMDVLGKGDSR